MAWSGTAIWVCPALCGCRLSLDADWVKQPEPGGDISYQHPIPKTIRTLSIEGVCAAHDHFRTDALPADPYGGSPGYLNPVPVSPTEAEKLYIQLFRYTGQRWKPDTCGCRIALCVDRFGAEPVKINQHPKHSMKCRHHEADDDQHIAARENHDRKNAAVAKLKEKFDFLTDDDIAWSFDDATRILRLKTIKLKANEKASAQLDHNPAKVVIE